jgi:hypothetical protein
VIRVCGLTAYCPPVSSHSFARPSRAVAVAVKDGCFLRPPDGLVFDGREHGGRLVCAAIDGRCVMPAFVVDR